MFSLTTTTAEQTQDLGREVGSLVTSGDVILLDGDLGTGKTTFTKGLALGLGIKRPIKSPTFTIIREYQEGRLPLYHMDVYRLEAGGGDELGLEEYFTGDGVSVIEWSQFVEDQLPANYLMIQLRRVAANEDTRRLNFISQGDHYQKLVEQLEDLNHE